MSTLHTTLQLCLADFNSTKWLCCISAFHFHISSPLTQGIFLLLLSLLQPCPLKDLGEDVTSTESFLWPLSQASVPSFSYWSKNWPTYQRTSREKRTIYLMISTETLNPLHKDTKKDREVFIRQYSQEMHYRNVSYIIKWHISLFPPWTPVYVSTSIRDGEKSNLKKIKITQ